MGGLDSASTHQVEDKLKQLRLQDWTKICRRRRWRWAGKLAHEISDHWAGVAVRWQPEVRTRGGAKGRCQGRPKKRWMDDLQKFVVEHGQSSWLEAAGDKLLWRSLEDDYVNHEV